MSKEISRVIRIDNWLFEVKAVRALKVKEYGEPYQAIANINLAGNSAYVDGIMAKNIDGISEEDYRHLRKVCKAFGVNQVEFAHQVIGPNEFKHLKGFA